MYVVNGSQTVSDISGHHARTLMLANQAGMFHWERASDRQIRPNQQQSILTMNLFAVNKDEHRDRLISRPKLQSETFPKPPNPDLPNPSFWNCLLHDSGTPSAVFFDMTNMFHQILLPESWRKYFPLTAILCKDLPSALRHVLEEKLDSSLKDTDVVTSVF